MKNLKIALIDSGVDINRKEFNNCNIKTINFKKNIFDDKDNIGHGTAISYILNKNIQNLELTSLKLFDKNYETSENDLIEALEYIYQYLDVDIIHLSIGIRYLNNEKVLFNICKKFKEKGVLIISSFENNGISSYPAKFDNVIGVSWYSYLKNTCEYIFVKNSIVNILAFSGILNLPWSNNTYKKVSGSSFSAAYITCKIAEILNKQVTKYDEILKELELDAKSTIVYTNTNVLNKFETYRLISKSIEKAIIFPVSKESHSLLGNIDLLDFQITGVYDPPQKGLIGKRIEDVVYGHFSSTLIIDSFKNINWNEEFDTVILGHTELLNCAFDNDFNKFFIQKCIEYSKNLYLFDNCDNLNSCIDEYNLKSNSSNWILNYSLKNDEIKQSTFGKLNKISNPVLCICGTSPCQGKFNIQLELRRRFINDNYYLGQIGTEPTSLLFGMDFMMHNGYNSNINLTSNNEIYFTNMLLSTLTDRDIIIIGLQSQTIPYTFGNLGFYPLSQHNILIASEPDAIILAINFNDELNYIERTINYLESYLNSKVIALVLYPYIKNFEWNLKGNNSRCMTQEELDTFKTKIEKKFNKKVFVNGIGADMDLLYSSCINFFSC